MRGVLAALVLLTGVARAADLKKPIAFSRVGSGPAIVFLHGLGGDGSVWNEVAARLRDRWTVVTVDLPGHGASGAPSDGRIDFERIAGQIADVVKQEKLAPAVLVGHSMGAGIAARVALVDPASTRALVLVDGFLARLPFPAAARADLRRELLGSRDQALKTFYGRIAATPAQADRVARAAAKVAPDLFVGYLDWAAEHELGERAAGLVMPVALFAGTMFLESPTDDAHTKEALRRIGYASVTTLTVERFGASKHWLWWDEPDHFHAALDGFLAKLPPLPPPPPEATAPAPKPRKRRR